MKKEKDEQDFKVINKILTISVIIVVSVCILLLAANIIISALSEHSIVIINFDYFAIIFAYLTFISFYSFIKLKNVYHLIIGIGFSLTFICMLVLHFINLVA